MEKILDLSKTVQELCKNDEDVIRIMKELGFDNIVKPGMLSTAGRFMTLPKGAVMKGIELDTIREAFIKNGYTIKE